MDSKALVSVIIPTYNREKVLARSIESVISQTYQNWELIIVDDRSTDNTKELVSIFMNKDKRIKYIMNDRKKGPSGARNCGMLHASGKYIAFLDSDDEWFAHHLNDSIEILENENVNVTFALWIENRSGELIKFDEQKEIKMKLEKAIDTLKPRMKDNLIFFDEGFYEFTVVENFYCYHINTMVFKREILDTIGLLDERLFANEDNDFTYRVFHEYGICLIRDYHFLYHEGQDNLYLFIDRSKADIEQISKDTALIEKLTFNGELENEMRKIRKNYIKRSDKIKDKKKCLNIINESIALKYFTLGYINRYTNKVRALKYYIKALGYGFGKLALIGAAKILLPVFFSKISMDPKEFDIG